MNPLQGITIVDFTRLLPGPMTTHLLAQMGAKVIKIESPKRADYARAMGVQVDGASMIFHQINHLKEIISVDYNTPEGKKKILEILKTADVLIEQFRPGAMDAWGLGYEQVKSINPDIVYVSITGYGQTGDYASEAGHDFNYLAYSGVMSLLKDQQGKPTVPDTQLADIGGAYMAVIALQAALLKKMTTGKGSYVDVSLADAVNPFLAIPFAISKSGLDYRQFNVINGKTTVNYAAYECADGKWLAIAALELKFWNNLCDILDKPDWKAQKDWELMNFNFPKKKVIAHFKTQTRDEWMRLLKGKDVCAAPILEIEELESSDYHLQQGTFEKFTTPNGTEFTGIRLPFRVG